YPVLTLAIGIGEPAGRAPISSTCPVFTASRRIASRRRSRRWKEISGSVTWRREGSAESVIACLRETRAVFPPRVRLLQRQPISSLAPRRWLESPAAAADCIAADLRA